MSIIDGRRRGTVRLAAAGVAATFVLASCAQSPSSQDQAPSGTPPAAATSAGPPAAPETGGPGGAAAGAPLPSAHVHALDRDPGTDAVLLATHEGLYVYGDSGPRRVGPVIDLMGFAVAGPGHYYASGHPGAGVDLPGLVGLIETRDGGATWTQLSRGGVSDFHALTTLGDGVAGFDGVLRMSTDGRSWTTGGLASPPRSLAGSADGTTVVATTQDGVMRSSDGGRTWREVPGAPLLLLVARGDGTTLAGTTPDGEIFVSPDLGLTWAGTGLRADAVQALDVSGAGAGVEISVVTSEAILVSRGGSPFVPVG